MANTNSRETQHLTPTVHVVEDDDGMRTALCTLLGTVGYHTAAYPGAKEFLQHFKPDEPGCLVLDIRMPQMSGLEFCQRVRAMPARAQVPIIILTAQGETATEAECVKAGANAFMTKPFSPKGLAAKVCDLLEAGTRQEGQA